MYLQSTSFGEIGKILHTILYEILSYKKDGIFVEIGANDGKTGSFTYNLANIGWKGIYCEPIPKLYQKCINNHINNKNVKIVPYGCSDKEETLQILEAGTLSSIDDTTINFNESNNDWESSLTHNAFDEKKVSKVVTQKIDTIIKDQKLDKYLLLIKLDIEGHELQALEGAKNTIKKYKPIIIIELSTYIFYKNDKAFDRFKSFLTEFNYSIYNTKKILTSLEDIIISIKSLDSEHETIGNYYLINDKNFLKFI